MKHDIKKHNSSIGIVDMSLEYLNISTYVFFQWKLWHNFEVKFLINMALVSWSIPVCRYNYNEKNLPFLCFCRLFIILFFFCLFVIFFCFLGLYLQHVEVPTLGVESELQMPAYTTVRAMWEMSWVCDLHLHHSSQQCWMLDPLRKARDRTRVLRDNGLVSAVLQQELPIIHFYVYIL